jgi:hypothetical protein
MVTARTRKQPVKKTAKKATKKRAPAKKAAKKAVKKRAPAKKAVKKKRVFNHGNQKAMHATAKSGYARDLPGQSVEPAERDGLTVPIATEGGVQEGRLAPSNKRYGRAKYGVVSASEAQANMLKRVNGELPPIEGGLDDMANSTDEDYEGDFDPLGGRDMDADAWPEPGSAELEAEEKALAEKTAQPLLADDAYSPTPPAPTQRPAPQPAPATNAMATYVGQRRRITLELVDGAMSMSAIDVKESRYGVTILLPLLADGATFIPKPGSEITVVSGETRWPCFFPGTYFECPELELLGIVFVKAEES